MTSLPPGDTTRSLLVGHDGLTTTNINNTTHTLSPSSSVINALPIIDPLHGLLLGNTTAFDALPGQQVDHRKHGSPSQAHQPVPIVTTTSPSTRINDRFPTGVNNDGDSATLHIKGEWCTRVRVD